MRMKKLFSFIVFAVIMTLISANTFLNHVSGQVQPITEVEEKLQGISDIEEAVLEDLFSFLRRLKKWKDRKTKLLLK